MPQKNDIDIFSKENYSHLEYIATITKRRSLINPKENPTF